MSISPLWGNIFFFLATLKRQNPYPGEGALSQFPVGSPPPHPGA